MVNNHPTKQTYNLNQTTMKDKKYHTAFDNLNTLNDIVLDKAHSMLKDLNNETELSILKTIQGNKPEHLNHLSDEEWEKHKKFGQMLLTKIKQP